MKIALIKNQVCENVAVFENLNIAKEMLGKIYDYIIECPEDRGINHRYINDIWLDPLTPEENNNVNEIYSPNQNAR